MTSARPLCQFW